MANKMIEIQGRQIEILCLAVGDIYSILSEIEKAEEGPTDLVDFLSAPDGVPLRVLRKMTNLTEDDVKSLMAEDLDRLVAAAKEANPHFFRVWAAIEAVRARLTQNMIEGNSPPPSAA